MVLVKSWPELVNTNRGWGPGPVNTNWVPGLVNTNWGPGPVNINWGLGRGPGPGPRAKERAGGQETQRPQFRNFQLEFKNVVHLNDRCSHWRCSIKGGTPKNLEIQSATLLKKRLQHSCFPVNYAKFLFMQNTFFTEYFRTTPSEMNFVSIENM